jgi:hypothetical protein
MGGGGRLDRKMAASGYACERSPTGRGRLASAGVSATTGSAGRLGRLGGSRQRVLKMQLLVWLCLDANNVCPSKHQHRLVVVIELGTLNQVTGGAFMQPCISSLARARDLHALPGLVRP